VENAEANRPKVRDYYPLKVGNQWTYELRSFGEKQTLAISIVSEKDGFFFDSTNAALRHDDTGLRDRNRYLIENPLEVGRKWISVQSVQSTEHFEITSVGEPCSSKAGSFANCVTVRSTSEVRPGRRLVIESTYAKNVGLVALQTEQLEGNSPATTQLELELISYKLAP
jgi:hypothetical protein